MGAQIDRAKGRIKEATGVLTGNKDLQRRGKADQVSAQAELNLQKGASQARKAVDHGAAEAQRLLGKGSSGAQEAIEKTRRALQNALKKK